MARGRGVQTDGEHKTRSSWEDDGELCAHVQQGEPTVAENRLPHLVAACKSLTNSSDLLLGRRFREALVA